MSYEVLIARHTIVNPLLRQKSENGAMVSGFPFRKDYITAIISIDMVIVWKKR